MKISLRRSKRSELARGDLLEGVKEKLDRMVLESQKHK